MIIVRPRELDSKCVLVRCIVLFPSMGIFTYHWYFFIGIDVITALMRAKKNNIPIRSKRLRDTVDQGTAYMLALMVSNLFQLYFMPIVPLLQIVAVFISTAKLKSIMENLGDLTMLDFWTFIKERLSGNNKNYSKHDDKIAEKLIMFKV